jgi:NAD(P)-dependent dehydrogenase (short-subunit alcohol dehydrogenase family)
MRFVLFYEHQLLRPRAEDAEQGLLADALEQVELADGLGFHSVWEVPYLGAYSAAKAGVSAMADVLRTEVAPTGTAVGVAYFGAVDTDMTRAAMAQPPAGPLRGGIGPRGSPQNPLSVRSAAGAIVQGVERRSRWIVLPSSGRWAVTAPRFARRAAEAVARRLLRG